MFLQFSSKAKEKWVFYTPKSLATNWEHCKSYRWVYSISICAYVKIFNNLLENQIHQKKNGEYKPQTNGTDSCM